MTKYELLNLIDLEIKEASEEVDNLLANWCEELRTLIREKIGFYAGLVKAREIIVKEWKNDEQRSVGSIEI